ncbi:hypothetical protein SCLCIDRAFT_1211964 [Scleroderma citrinum Foug A]|uniref:Uncharacterized protein n=1 Tax=Scleroderma citrinum Foug A TaxID=1036808 RepID=A0A0C2ZWW2_9AGAM|nr:hypothetical protein SCLCIDRAFT_1211964 [Scleroderma citrinum Foug A]
MVQGKTKGLQSKSSSSRQSKPSQTKKGKRVQPPKKPTLAKEAAVRKALTAKHTRSIEQQMASAASSGKLTIMKNTAEPDSSGKGIKNAKR